MALALVCNEEEREREGGAETGPETERKKKQKKERNVGQNQSLSYCQAVDLPENERGL